MFCTDCPSGLQECAGQKTLIIKTTITITGSYFPRHGNFLCQFYDTVTLDSQCRSTGMWINAATISCQVPKMRRARKLRVLVSSDAQQFSESSVQLTTYSVLAIQPMCIPTLGQARMLVSGNNLWPEPGQSPQITAYCRFGKVSETLGSTSDDKLENWWAYHTVATVSDIEGSLECDAPPKGVLLATYDFALSLDACECGREGCPACLVKWNVPIGGQNYFYGQWDSTMGEWHQATGLPTVEMRTVIVPEIYSSYQLQASCRVAPRLLCWEKTSPGVAATGEPMQHPHAGLARLSRLRSISSTRARWCV